MRSGFTFNGKHTGTFKGVTVRTKDRPVFPDVKEQTYEAAEMDGMYDFSDVSGREYFKTRDFQIEFLIQSRSLRELQMTLTAVSRWFRGRGTLVFDDMPLAVWNVRIFDSVSYVPEHGGKRAVLSVTYRAMPFSDLIFDLYEGPVLDSDLELDANFPIGGGMEFLMLSGSGTYSHVPNVGDGHIKPVITVTGAANPFKISINGTELAVAASGSLVIDCEKEYVTGGNKSLMGVVTGEFPVLNPGADNVVSVSTNECVQIRYTPKFLYDAYFDDTVMWGDEDAG